MSRIVLNIVFGAKHSQCENDASTVVELFLSVTLIVSDIGKLLETMARGWFATLRRILKAFLLDESAE